MCSVRSLLVLLMLGAATVHAALAAQYVVPQAQSLAERIARVDAVLIVRVQQTRIGSFDANPDDVKLFAQLGRTAPAMPALQYRVQVIENLKTHPSIIERSALVVYQRAGHGNDGGPTLDGIPSLRRPGAYLVFLEFDPRLPALLVSPIDIYPLRGERLEPNRLSTETAYAAEIFNRPVADVVAHLRQVIPSGR